MVGRLAGAWTWVWAWAAFLAMGIPKVISVAEASSPPGALPALAALGQTQGIPAPIFCSPSAPGEAGGLSTAFGADAGNPGCLAHSRASVNYFTGELMYESTDLASGGFGGWGHTRSFFIKAEDTTHFMSPGWEVVQWPLLTEKLGFAGTKIAKTGARHTRSFSSVGGSPPFTAQHYYKDSLALNGPAQEYLLTDTRGNRTYYHQISGAGRLKQFIDAAGNVTTVTYDSPSNGNLLQIYRTFGTTEERWVYTYSGPGGRVTNLKLERQVNLGGWTTVRQVDYTYYGASDPNGPEFYLKRAIVKDGAGSVLEQKYHRYYAADAFLWVGVKYVVEGIAYERLKAANGGTDAGVDSAPNTGVSNAVENFADLYVEYEVPATANHKVTKVVKQGVGCSCTGNNSRGRFTFTYPAISDLGDAYNFRKRKTVETFRDMNDVAQWTKTVYTNYVGEAMLEVFDDLLGKMWRTYTQYDSSGRLTMTAMPSAVTGHDEAQAGLVLSSHLKDGEGLIYKSEYGTATTATPTTAGDVTGYLKKTRCQAGELGAPATKALDQYFSHTDGIAITIYPLARRTAYRTEGEIGPVATDFTYTWQGTSNEVFQRTTLHPAVLTSQNGPGTRDQEDEQFDAYGRRIWRRDGNLFVHTTAYNAGTGAVTQQIADSGGLNLITSYDVDGLGRVTKETDPLGQLTYTIYKDTNWETRTYPGWDTVPNPDRPTGPTIVARRDKGGGYTETLATSITPSSTAGVPTGLEVIDGTTLDGTLPTVNWYSLSRIYEDTGGRPANQDGYYNLSGLTYSTAVNIGTQGTHYLRTSYTYDELGNREKTTDRTGTISKDVFDRKGRIIEKWIGTTDANLIKSEAFEYDNHLTISPGIGNSALSRSKRFTSPTVSQDTNFKFDFRDRETDRLTPTRLSFHTTWDNLDRQTVLERYSDWNGNLIFDASERRAMQETKYDEKGQVFQAVRHHVDLFFGTLGNRLTTNFWSNARWMRIKTASPNGLFEKAQYDGAGRVKASFTSHDSNEFYYDYAAADDVVGDAVIEEMVPSYDAASQVIQETRYQRTSSASVPSGDLATGWAVGNSRRTFVAMWHDKANRRTSVVDYGDNNNVNLIRPTNPPNPNSSNNYIVTETGYEAGGRPYRTTNNLNKITESTFDGLDRVTKVVEDYVNGVVVETELDTDRTTEYLYDSSGQLSQVKAHNPKGSGLGVEQQITTYVYTTIANQSSPAVFRKDLLTAIIYPDSDDTYNSGAPAGSQLGNGNDAVYDRQEYTYTHFSRIATSKNALGTVITYTWQTPEQLYTAGVTQLGTGVDGSVRGLEFMRSADFADQLFGMRSWDNPTPGFGSELNKTQMDFDGWGNVTTVDQNHLNGSSGGNPQVVYTYSDGAVGGEAQFLRVTSITYPNGRIVNVDYPGTNDDKLSRVGRLAHSTGSPVFAEYTYLGASDIVRITHPAVTGGLTLDYGIDTGDPVGWDRLSRIIDHKWGSGADPNKFDRFQYTYDRMSMRLNSDRTYTGAPTNRDEQNIYDNLHRLKQMKRGTIASGSISNANSTFNTEWTALDILGNWREWRRDLNGGTPVWDTQQRKHNKANEIDVDDNDANPAGASIIQTTGAGMDWLDPTYDKAGNMKTAAKPGAETDGTERLHFTYDAWNRLVKVQDDNGSGAPGVTLAEYRYDGFNQRITKLKPNGSNWDRRDYYYTLEAQCIEEREALNVPPASKDTPATTPEFQWVWDVRYAGAAVLRDENKDGDGDCVDGTDERLFYVQDASYNTTALVSVAGAVVERYSYEPYGRAAVFNASWVSQASTIYNNEVLFAGNRLDPETGLYQVSNREYHPTLGRWLQRDPLGFPAVANLYEYVRSNPYHPSPRRNLIMAPTQIANITARPALTTQALGTKFCLAEFFDTTAGTTFRSQIMGLAANNPQIYALADAVAPDTVTSIVMGVPPAGLKRRAYHNATDRYDAVQDAAFAAMPPPAPGVFVPGPPAEMSWSYAGGWATGLPATNATSTGLPFDWWYQFSVDITCNYARSGPRTVHLNIHIRGAGTPMDPPYAVRSGIETPKYRDVK